MSKIFKRPIDFFHHMVRIGLNVLAIFIVIAAGVLYWIFLLL